MIFHESVDPDQLVCSDLDQKVSEYDQEIPQSQTAD